MPLFNSKARTCIQQLNTRPDPLLSVVETIPLPSGPTQLKIKFTKELPSISPIPHPGWFGILIFASVHRYFTCHGRNQVGFHSDEPAFPTIIPLYPDYYGQKPGAAGSLLRVCYVFPTGSKFFRPDPQLWSTLCRSTYGTAISLSQALRYRFVFRSTSRPFSTVTRSSTHRRHIIYLRFRILVPPQSTPIAIALPSLFWP
jgi:hypothetical protein